MEINIWFQYLSAYIWTEMIFKDMNVRATDVTRVQWMQWYAIPAIFN